MAQTHKTTKSLAYAGVGSEAYQAAAKNITALSIEAFHNASGGTGQAIRLAERLSIHVFNLFEDEAVDKLQDFVYKTELLE